jgi:hypothetical protein
MKEEYRCPAFLLMQSRHMCVKWWKWTEKRTSKSINIK